MFWDGMPYAWPVIGWESDLNSITRQQAKDFFQYYAPHNITFILVGDFQHAPTVKMIKKYLGGIPGSDKEIPLVVTKNEVGPFEKRMLVNLDKVSPQLRIRFHTVKSNAADIYPLLVLSEMLDSKVGLMDQKLVNGDDPIALKGGVYAYQWGLKYAGYFEMGATAVANDKLDSLENRMLDLLNDTKNVTDDELLNAKKNVIMKRHMLLDSNEGYLKFLMSSVYAEGWQSINNYSGFINDVSIDDIKRVVDTYLDPKLRSVLVVSKVSSQ
jgi:zinc protease